VLAMLISAAGTATAQPEYPNRPIRFIIDYPDGSLTNPFRSVIRKRPAFSQGINDAGAPGPVRTGDFRFRRPILYPSELRALSEAHNQNASNNNPCLYIPTQGHGENIVSRHYYQAALC
jgi:hypothetical protein